MKEEDLYNQKVQIAKKIYMDTGDYNQAAKVGIEVDKLQKIGFNLGWDDEYTIIKDEKIALTSTYTALTGVDNKQRRRELLEFNSLELMAAVADMLTGANSGKRPKLTTEEMTALGGLIAKLSPVLVEPEKKTDNTVNVNIQLNKLQQAVSTLGSSKIDWQLEGDDVKEIKQLN